MMRNSQERKTGVSMISLLVAMDKNNVIGYKNDLPWHLPRDLKYFKEKTTGHTIIMGRKTFESIGRPLPNRRNIVVTRNKTFVQEGVEVIHDLATIWQLNDESPREELFIIGGAELYRQALPHADRLYITKIEETFEGDTYFPTFSEAEWELTKKEQGIQDENNPYEYYFLQYERKK